MTTRVAVLVPRELPSWLHNSDFRQNRTLLSLGAWAPELEMVPMPANEMAWTAVAPLAIARAAHAVGAHRLWKATMWSAWITRPLDADVIVAHGLYPVHAPWVRQRLPLVWGPGYDPADLAGRAERRVDPRFRARLATCRRVFVPTDAGADALRADVPGTPVVTIPIFQPHLPRADRLPERPPRAGRTKVLFVAREARRKNLAGLVSALERVRAGGIDLALTVISGFRDGPVEVPAGTTILPEQTQAGIFEALLAHDILCIPSRQETYGMTYVEALAAGTAVIAKDAPSQRAMMEDGARYAESVDAIAAALVALASPEIREAQVARARAIYATRFAPDVVARRFAQALTT